jgi:uncharacterized membrane protein
MGILFSLVCALFSSSKDLVSKKLAFTVTGAVSAFASFTFALPYYLVLLLGLWMAGYETFALSREFLILVLLRSATDVCAEWFKMSAFRHGDISLVAPFLSLTPLFLLLTSPLITGDRPAPIAILGVLLIITGNFALLRGRMRKGSGGRRGILYGAASALFFSLNTCFDRLTVQTASPVLSGFAMTLVAAFLLIPTLGREQGLPVLRAHAAPFLVRGFLETAFMVSKLTALQFLQASYVDGITKLSLLISIIGGRYVFKEEDFLQRLIAGALVTSGVLLIAITAAGGN